jgi:hypothetical protein
MAMGLCVSECLYHHHRARFWMVFTFPFFLAEWKDIESNRWAWYLVLLAAGFVYEWILRRSVFSGFHFWSDAVDGVSGLFLCARGILYRRVSRRRKRLGSIWRQAVFLKLLPKAHLSLSLSLSLSLYISSVMFGVFSFVCHEAWMDDWNLHVFAHATSLRVRVFYLSKQGSWSWLFYAIGEYG